MWRSPPGSSHRDPGPAYMWTILRQVFTTQGLPDVIMPDDEPAFASTEYLAWQTKNEIHLMVVPPYHPASNGAGERVVQTIKDKLKKSQTGNFRTEIAQILFQYRTTPHDVTGRAPSELLLGRVVKTPLDDLHPDLRSTVLMSQLKQKLAADRGCRPGPLAESGAPVFARNFRPVPPWSDGQVVAPASASSLLVRMPDGATWQRHADHVRPRLGTWPAPLTATSEFQPVGGLAAAPVAFSGAPPTSEAASIISGAAPVVPAPNPAPLARKAVSGSIRRCHTRPVNTGAQAEYSMAEAAVPFLA
ncbi:uncharacterized protein [Dermacentor albipictus]|uniref:uncharacterized protein n=1 Tax=Dermacentor albipictus TaxID=60249 RepID=UPI0038FC02FC